jgi:ankyrin repeat protein
MATAMSRLHTLKRDTEKLFFGEAHDDLFPEYMAGLPTEAYQFELFFRRLDRMVLQETANVLAPSNRGNDSATLMSLITVVLSPESLILGKPAPGHCPVCQRNENLGPLLGHLRESDGLGALLVAKLTCVKMSLEYPDHWRGKHNESSCQSEWEHLMELVDPYLMEVYGVLRSAYQGLLSDMPTKARNFPMYIPEDLSRVMLLDFDTIVDCLGRTRLHQYLDYLGTSPSDKHIETDVLDAMLDHLADPNVTDILGRTVLHAACQISSKHFAVKVVEKLLAVGADATRKTVSDSLPLHYAAANGSLPICSMLLPVTGSHVNDLDEMGLTALYYSVRNRYTSLVKLLLQPGQLAGGLSVDPDRHANASGYFSSPLLEAMSQDDPTMVQHLLMAGADPCTEDDNPSVFTYAAKKNDTEILKIIGANTQLSRIL